MMEENVDFRKLYFKMFNWQLKMLDQLEAMAEQLKQMQIECEEMYISPPDEEEPAL